MQSRRLSQSLRKVQEAPTQEFTWPPPPQYNLISLPSTLLRRDCLCAMDGEVIPDHEMTRDAVEDATNDAPELNGQSPVPEDMQAEPTLEQSPAVPTSLNGAIDEDQDIKEEQPTDAPHTPMLHDGTPDYKTKYILSGHARSISAIKFSPDGTMLASCGADKVVKIWDVYNGELIQTLEGHTEGISDVAWSQDGEFIASASDDKTIIIWSIEELSLAKVLKGHTNFVFCVNFSPSSNLLVSGGFDETVRIWDVARGRPLKTLPAHSDPVTAVTFNHDGTIVASCSMDGLIRVWDADSGQCLKTLVDDDNPICSHIKFTPNSRFILASTQDSTVRLWNTETSRCVKTYKGHTNRTYSIFVDFVPGGKQIMSGSEDCKVYLWDLQTRQIIQVLEGHRDVVIAVASHPHRPIIASASMEKDLTIRIWHDKNAPST